MRILLLWAVMAVGFGACDRVMADDPKPDVAAAKVIKVPYVLTETKHVMVRVKINGKGPFNLILDTGAPAMFITTKVAKDVGLKNTKGWSDLETLVLEGGIKVEGARCRAEDLFQLDGMNSLGIAGFELHGVIGYEILARYRITYDFTKDKIEWLTLDFKPEKLQAVGGGGQGSLEMIGPFIKMFSGLMGIEPNFKFVGRGFAGVVLKDEAQGVVIANVLVDSPAEKAGLRPGDRIVTGKAKAITKAADLNAITAKLKVGDKLTFEIDRDGDKKTITVELGKGL
jgi:serine protease DegQ